MSELPEKLYTAEQVRRLDACAINEHGIPGYELMSRAGAALVEAAQLRFPDAVNWTIVCGAGNNGGDGYVAAGMIRAAGNNVRLYALKTPGALTGDAHTAAQDWLQAGGAVHEWPPESGHGTPDLVIDALLGTGLDRPVEGRYADAINWMSTQDCPVIAVDIPSGLNADTGQVMGTAVAAHATVSFIGLKRGLFTCDGPDYAGEVIFDSLRVPDEIYAAAGDSGDFIHEKLLVDLLKPRNRNAHKGNFGHVLVAGGHAGMAGAVRLAGEAALRSGSGLVSIATHEAHAAALNLARPELMVSAVSDKEGLQALLGRSSVVAVGPGLGSGRWAEMVLEACLDCAHPLVVDADGLNLLARSKIQRENWILTPHPAEAARLLGTSTQGIQSDRVASAVALAERYNAVIVLKGCGTVVAAHDGRYSICPLGNPGMATAGSGDVLTGVIASLAGQGLEPWQAAQLGVVIHAAAGDRAAEISGERGMLAGDITNAIPAVVR